MSLRAMHAAATGMQAQLTQLDTTANNLANAGTTAFKRSRVNFEDLFYQQFRLPGAQDSQGLTTPLGIAIGAGTKVASTTPEFSPGSLIETNSQYDLAIRGNGFFQVQGDNGETLYTRAGNFTLNDQSQIVTGSAERGRLLFPTITIDPTAENVSISPEGIVAVKLPGQPEPQNVATIELARFANPQGLLQLGDNLFGQSVASGTPIPTTPGQDGVGTLLQNRLETSNVEPVDELISLIKTQRNVELNSQVVQAADQLLQMISNLRRF